MRVKLQVDRPGREVHGAQRPRRRGAHVEDADNRVCRERAAAAAGGPAPDGDGARRGEQVSAAVRGQDRRAVRRDVGDGPPPGPRVQEQDPPVGRPDGEQPPRRRRERRGAVWRGGGRCLGDEAAPRLAPRAGQVHRHQGGAGPPGDDDVPPGPGQGRDAGEAGRGRVRGAEGGQRAPAGGVDGKRGPRGDGDGPAAKRGEPLDAAPSRAGRAVPLEGGAGGAIDGAGVGS